MFFFTALNLLLQHPHTSQLRWQGRCRQGLLPLAITVNTMSTSLRKEKCPLAVVNTVDIRGKRYCVSSSGLMTTLSKDSDDMMLTRTLAVESGLSRHSPAPVAGGRPSHAPRSNVDGHDYQRQDALDNSVYPDEGILINTTFPFAM